LVQDVRVSEGITFQQEAEGDSAGSEISCRRTADGKTHQLAPVKLQLSAMSAKLLPRSQPPLENERGLIHVAEQLVPFHRHRIGDFFQWLCNSYSRFFGYTLDGSSSLTAHSDQ